MPDLIEAITDDHEALGAAVDRLEALGRSGPADEHRAVVQEVVEEARRHSVAERDVVLPALVHSAPDGPERAVAGTEFHDRLDEVVTRLDQTSSDDSGHFNAMTELITLLREHVGTAEEDLLPSLRESLTGDTREDLGEAYVQARKAGLTS